MHKRGTFVKYNWAKSDLDLAASAKNKGVWPDKMSITDVMDSVKAYRRNIRAFYVQDNTGLDREIALIFVDNCGRFEPYKAKRVDIIFKIQQVFARQNMN